MELSDPALQGLNYFLFSGHAIGTGSLVIYYSLTGSSVWVPFLLRNQLQAPLTAGYVPSFKKNPEKYVCVAYLIKNGLADLTFTAVGETIVSNQQTLPKKAFRKIANIFGYELLKDRDIIKQKEGYHYVPDIYGKSNPKLRDIREDKTFLELADKAREHKRTFLYYDRLYSLYQAIENLSRNVKKADRVRLLEVGVYKGGGSYFISSCAQKMFSLPLQVFSVDTFKGHSEKDFPEGKDGDHLPGQFSETSYESVRDYLSCFPFVKVLPGRIQDVTPELGNEPFHFMHLDVDIYEPTFYALNAFGKSLAQHGIVVVDDYGYLTCPGVRKAVDEYIENNPGLFVKFELLTGQCLLVKQGG